MKIQQVNNVRIPRQLKNLKQLSKNVEKTNTPENFTEPAFPIVISKEEMKNYTKQVMEKVADWKKIFG